MYKKILAFIGFIVLIAGAVGGVLYFLKCRRDKEEEQEFNFDDYEFDDCCCDDCDCDDECDCGCDDCEAEKTEESDN